MVEMASTSSGSSGKARSFAMDIPHRGDGRAYPSRADRPRRSPRHHSHIIDSGASSLSSENSSPSLSTQPPSHSHLRGDSRPRLFSNSSQHDGSPSALPHSPTALLKLEDKVSVELEPPSTIAHDLMPALGSPLGPAMLSNQTYTSINLNRSDPDEPPRLITFTKAGQGFHWNEELFLPSYLINRYSRSRRKLFDGDFGDDDVDIAEIFVTDEEAEQLIP